MQPETRTHRGHVYLLCSTFLYHVKECFPCQYKQHKTKTNKRTHTQTLSMKSLCVQGGTKMTFKAFTLLADLSASEGWSRRQNSRTMIPVGVVIDVQCMLSESYGQTAAESCWQAKAATVAYLANPTGSVRCGWKQLENVSFFSSLLMWMRCSSTVAVKRTKPLWGLVGELVEIAHLQRIKH